MARQLRRLATPALAMALALAGVACGQDDGAVAEPSSGSTSATSASECSPVNPDLEAVTSIDVALVDYGFEPSTIEVEAGVIEFVASNEGEERHDFGLMLDDGAPIGLEAFGPGQVCTATYDLEPGTYTMFCAVVTADGTPHYEIGMRGTLEVTAG